MNVKVAILVLYILTLSGITAFAARIQKKNQGGAIGYLLAGRNLPTIMVATMLAGLAIGGASTVGVAQNAYTRGLSAGWYNAAWGTAGIAVGLLAAGFLRKSKMTTIPQMMGTLYGPGARVLGALGQLLIMMVITSLQYVAGGAVLSAILPDVFSFQTGMIVTAALFVGVALIGGYLAGGIANIINVIVIYVGIAAALVASLKGAGGMDQLALSLPADGPWFDPVSGVGVMMVVAWMVVMITQAFSVQAISQIAFAARDEKTAQKGFILGGIIILPAGFLCAIFGIIAAARYPGLENSAMALPTLVAAISPFVGGLFLAALWAADISTAVGLLLGSSTLVLEDIVKRTLPESAWKGREILFSRLVILLVSCLTYYLALTSVSILKSVTTGLSITVSFTLLIITCRFFPGVCKRANGFWTILASILVWLAWTFIPETHIVPHVVYLEWPICLGVFALTSLVGKAPVGAMVVETVTPDLSNTALEEA